MAIGLVLFHPHLLSGIETRVLEDKERRMTWNPRITKAKSAFVGSFPGVTMKRDLVIHTSPVWGWTQSLPMNLAKNSTLVNFK